MENGRSASRSKSRTPQKSRSRTPSAGGERYRTRSRSGEKKRSRSRSRERRSRSRSYSRSRSRSHSRGRRAGGRRNSRSRSRSFGRGGPGSRFDPRRDNPDPSRCLGVFGLNYDTTERELRRYFSKFGNIESITLIYDRMSGRSRGFGFVNFERTEDATIAREEMNGQEVQGYRIRVDFSVTKRPHSPTPGVYMGDSSFRSGGGGGGGGGRRSPGGFRRRSRSRDRRY